MELRTGGHRRPRTSGLWPTREGLLLQRQWKPIVFTFTLLCLLACTHSEENAATNAVSSQGQRGPRGGMQSGYTASYSREQMPPGNDEEVKRRIGKKPECPKACGEKSTPSPYSGYSAQWSSGGCLSGEAGDVLGLLNVFRECPWQFIPALKQRKALYDGNKLLRIGQPAMDSCEGPSAVDDAIAALVSAEPLPRLRPSCGMTRASQMVVDDAAKTGLKGEILTDGSTAATRLAKFGSPSCGTGEVRLFGTKDPCDMVLDMLVDDCHADRGRRSMLLNPQYRSIGVATGSHSSGKALTISLAGDFVEGKKSEDVADPASAGACPMEDEVGGVSNALRCSPGELAALLKARRSFYHDGPPPYYQKPGGSKHVLQEGWSAVEEAIAALEAASSLPGLKTSKGLTASAKAHAQDLGKTGNTGKQGSDGSDPKSRMDRHGSVSGGKRTGRGSDEVIVTGPMNSAIDVILNALVSDGDKSRSSRNTLLDAGYCAVGVGIGPHKSRHNVAVIDLAEWHKEKDGSITGTQGAGPCPPC